MTIQQAFRTVMKQTNNTQAMLAERRGVKQQSLYDSITKNPTMKIATEIFDMMGYEMVVQPKRRGRRPEGQIVIGGDDDE